MINLKLYEDTEPVNVEFKDSSHRYKVDGEAKPGVSSVLNILAKDLMDWAVYMAVGSFKDAVMPYATTDNKLTKIALKYIADEAKKAHRVKSQRGMDVGSIVHAWIKEEVEAKYGIEVPEYVLDLLDKANEDESEIINENLVTATHCVEQWRQWCIDEDIEFIKTEQIVYSKKLDYCGTFDCLYKSRRTGKVYIGDYKTGDPQKIRNSKFVIIGYKPYPEVFVQCSGYDYAHYEETGLDPDGYAAIYLPKTGNYQVFTREQVEEDRQNWEYLFHVYKWIDKLKKAKK